MGNPTRDAEPNDERRSSALLESTTSTAANEEGDDHTLNIVDVDADDKNDDKNDDDIILKVVLNDDDENDEEKAMNEANDSFSSPQDEADVPKSEEKKKKKKKDEAGKIVAKEKTKKTTPNDKEPLPKDPQEDENLSMSNASKQDDSIASTLNDRSIKEQYQSAPKPASSKSTIINPGVDEITASNHDTIGSGEDARPLGDIESGEESSMLVAAVAVSANGNPSGELIQAELVKENLIVAEDAEVLKDIESKQRRNILILIAVILGIAAIVIAVVVTTVQGGGGGGDESNNNNNNNVVPPDNTTTNETPTVSPTTAPSSSPSGAPSFMPSAAPSYLTFQEIDPRNPLDASQNHVYNFGGGGRVGESVALADIRGTSLEDLSNKTSLLLVQISSSRHYSADCCGTWISTEQFVLYFCDEDGCIDGAVYYNYDFRLSAYGPTAMTENGALVAVDTGSGIEVFDLEQQSAETLLTKNAILQDPFSLTHSTTASWDLAMHPRGDWLAEIPAASFPGQSRRMLFLHPVKTRLSLDVPVLSFIWGAPPLFCSDAMGLEVPCGEETLYMVDMDDTAVAVGTNTVPFRVPVPLAQEAVESFKIRVFDFSLQNQIGNTIEGDAGSILFSQHNNVHAGRGLVLTANATILAVSSAAASLSSDQLSYSVDVYQLSNETWSRMGSRLEGSSPGDEFGQSISMSKDGTFMAVGAPLNSGRVATFEWEENVGDWVSFEDLSSFEHTDYGNSVSLLPDGSQLAVGNPHSFINGHGSGQAYLYQLRGSE